MKTRHPILVVKGMRQKRCEQAMHESRRRLRSVRQQHRQALGRAVAISQQAAALRAALSAPAGASTQQSASQRDAWHMTAIDAQAQRTALAVPPARQRCVDFARAVQEAQEQHARCVADWLAARESLRIAEERLREEARQQQLQCENRQEEELGEVRAARQRSRPGPRTS